MQDSSQSVIVSKEEKLIVLKAYHSNDAGECHFGIENAIANGFKLAM